MELNRLHSYFEILGDIPKWVHGKFIRVGPAKFELDDGFAMNHWYCLFIVPVLVLIKKIKKILD